MQTMAQSCRANSTTPYMAVTLPPTTAIAMGWTMGIATDGDKTAAVQVNASSGGRILYPGSGAAVTSASLANANYELLVLQFDGSNFRVTEASPATATLLGINGNSPGSIVGAFPPSVPMRRREGIMEMLYQAITHRRAR